MKCRDCDGVGFKEYDAGLVQIGCKACGMTGKVDCELTKEEFEKAYAFRSDMTPGQVAVLGLVAMPSDCLEGWAMQNVANIVEEQHPQLVSDAVLDAAIEVIVADSKKVEDLTNEEIVEVVEGIDNAEEAEVEKARKILEAPSDSDSGTGQDNQPARGDNTSKPKRTSKPKTKKKATKRAG